MGRRRVVITAFEGMQTLDLTGPMEVFAVATRLLAAGGRHDEGYVITVVSHVTPSITTWSGLTIGTTHLPQPSSPIDTIVIPGGEGVHDAIADGRLVTWVGRHQHRARRVVSVCTGAFVLAEAGLLDGRPATTHWSACARLARDHPSVTVHPDRIFVRDGRIATSAGVTAGMDLALALVEEDYGPAVALDAARQLVMYMKRPGGQSQFSGYLRAQLARRQPLRELQEWIADHLDADLSVSALARRVGMSPRHLARSFRDELGTTPADYVERLRVDAARHWLEATDLGIPQIAAACGFGTVETFYRCFQRRVHVSPGRYRERFTASSEAFA